MLSRQLYEEAVHVQFYLTLLDTYIPDYKKRESVFVYGLQDVQEFANFFERRASAYQVAVAGDVAFDEAF